MMNVDHIPELKIIQEKTGYIALDPGSKKVYYLEVIDLNGSLILKNKK